MLPSYSHKIQYYETDQMGVVHHSNYIRWFEEARVFFMEDMGIPYDKMEKDGIISPVLSIQCEYKSMSRFGETVTLRAKLRTYTGTKMTISYEITDSQTGIRRCSGESSHCFLKNQRPISLKKHAPELHRIFQSYLEEQ